ncbi:DNA methyltransferase, partial [bacterium]|nr:DNA methyltransferase [bacterium]
RFGYDFQKDERLNVYLTNSLEETLYKTEELLGSMKIISQEANAASTVKNRLPILVVLGNPPYSGHSANSGAWISKLIRDYYFVDGEPLGEKNPKWLQDDYVKFLRYGQWRIAQWTVGNHDAQGILAFITNHSYLDNPTFRGMRRSLQRTFDEIYVLDLHGNSKKKEQTPTGGKDENVFDIMQGVSIGLFVKAREKEQGVIRRGDLWGKRDQKYDWLSAQDHKHTKWKKIEPSKPFYLFCHSESKDQGEFYQLNSLTGAFQRNVLGFQTHRDDFAVAWHDTELIRRIELFASKGKSDFEIKTEFALRDDEVWISNAREALRKDKERREKIVPCLYRPFDVRYCVFSHAIMDRPRTELLRHVFRKENLTLMASRQQAIPGFRHVFCSNQLAESCVVSLKTREQNYNFPLYLYPSDGSPRKPNLDPKFVSEFAAKLGLKFVEEGARWAGDIAGLETHNGGKKKSRRGDPVWSPAKEFGPEDIFYYIYAVFHSPTYRERYKEFLKIDFPRVPLTSNLDLFKTLVPLGHELVQYHLLEHPDLGSTPIVFPERGSNIVERVQYVDTMQRVTINKEQHFERVTPEVWNFHVGGYQVCQKWLKDRKERTLTHDEIKHYEKTVMALGETIRLMNAIDQAIPSWPIE